jgi:lysophospholipase L1-like esterase
MMDGGQRGEARLGPYVEAARRVAKKMNGAGTDVRLVDVYEQMHAHCHKHSMTMDELFYDGLHLSGEGNNVLYRIVAKALIACGLQPTALPRQRPSGTHTLMIKANPQWAPDAEDRMPESMP